MIATLRGKLRRKLDDRVVLEAGGVGYEVYLPPVTQQALVGASPADGEGADEVFLAIHFHATQNQPRPVLIGFTSELDREFFEKLITVKDVGPLVAARSPGRADGRDRSRHRPRGRGLPPPAARASAPQKAKNIVAQLHGKVAKFALAHDGAPRSRSGGRAGQRRATRMGCAPWCSRSSSSSSATGPGRPPS